MDTLTWEQFVDSSKALAGLLEDSAWSLEGDISQGVARLYLKHVVLRNQGELGPSTDEGVRHSELEPAANMDFVKDWKKSMIKCEYHIIYSISYAVPVLYFNFTYGDGTLLKIEDVWSIFRNNSTPDSIGDQMWSTVSQQDHPILHIPFFSIHPCQTAAFMKELWKNPTNQPLSYLISWVSIVGGKVGIKLPTKCITGMFPVEQSQ